MQGHLKLSWWWCGWNTGASVQNKPARCMSYRSPGACLDLGVLSHVKVPDTGHLCWNLTVDHKRFTHECRGIQAETRKKNKSKHHIDHLEQNIAEPVTDFKPVTGECNDTEVSWVQRTPHMLFKNKQTKQKITPDWLTSTHVAPWLSSVNISPKFVIFILFCKNTFPILKHKNI